MTTKPVVNFPAYRISDNGTLHGNITPGPWRVKAGDEYVIEGANGQRVLLIGDKRRLIPMLADEALILAAPELLEALKDILAAYHGLTLGRQDSEWEGQFKVKARKAIAKAEGKQ
jgi:hypothetical protein